MKSQKELKKDAKMLASGLVVKGLEERMREARSRRSISSTLLRIGGRDPTLRAKFLEFVQELPQFKSASEVRKHFEIYLRPHRALFPSPIRWGSYVMKMPIAHRFAVVFIRWLIYKKLAPYFIIKDEDSIEKFRQAYEKEGAGIIVDFLGELVVFEREAESFFVRYIESMHRAYFETKFLKWDKGRTYGYPFHIAVKFSSLYPFFGPENYEESKRRVQEKFERILYNAQRYGAFVEVDAEQYDCRGLIEDIFCETILKPEFRKITRVEIASQAYFKDSFISAMNLLDVAKERGTPFAIRLVKGAYWDEEVRIAQEKGEQPPVLNEKWKTDESFDTILYYLLRHWEYVHVSPATHSPESIAFAYCAMKEFGVLENPNFAFQVLRGLGEPMRKVLCDMNVPVLVYSGVSSGDLADDMAFFARRIKENISNEGILYRLL